MPSRRKLLSKTKKSLFEWKINKRTLLQRKSNEKSMKMNENHGISDSMSVLTFRRNFFIFESNFLRDGIILFIESSCVVTAWTSFITPVIFRAWEIEIRCLILGIVKVGRISYDFYIIHWYLSRISCFYT